MPEIAKAVKDLPRWFTGYDPIGQHKTPADLAFSVQLQIDLYEDDETSDIRSKRQYQQAKRYVKTWSAR